MAGQSQHDDDEQNQSQAAAGSVTPASAVAPGGERPDQCEYQYDNEDGSKHGVASFLCTLPGNNAEGCARFQVRVAYLDRESAAISRAMSLWILTLLSILMRNMLRVWSWFFDHLRPYHACK